MVPSGAGMDWNFLGPGFIVDAGQRRGEGGFCLENKQVRVC